MYKLILKDLRCQSNFVLSDINECEESGERVCSHACLNTIGSYRCSCRNGYRKV